MFYLSEIYYRFFYVFISMCLNIFLLYIYKNDIIFITLIPVFLKNNLLDYFIFTEPKEILFFYLYSCFSFLLFLSIPYLFINIIDYIKTAMYFKEWIRLKNLKFYILITYFIINILTFFIGLPLFWSFFSSFQNYSNLFTFFLELSALNYFYYFNSIFLLTNLLQILLVSFLFLFYKKRLLSIIKNKAYIYLIFLLFSTLVTPPDLFLQITLFCSLYICLEIVIFCILIFYFYLNKN